MSEQQEGWVYLRDSKRLHWFRSPVGVSSSYSFCDQWRITTTTPRPWQGFVSNPQPGDCCKACERMRGVYERRDKREAK